MPLSWDEVWLEVAEAMSFRSKCANRQVGAVIVDRANRVVATGYNGQPANYSYVHKSGTCADFCPRSDASEEERRDGSYDDCIAIHAEANALLFADRSHYEGGTIYITNPPCFNCAKLIANSGLKRVVCFAGYEDRYADIATPAEFLRRSGLHIDIYRRNDKEERNE